MNGSMHNRNHLIAGTNKLYMGYQWVIEDLELAVTRYIYSVSKISPTCECPLATGDMDAVGP